MSAHALAHLRKIVVVASLLTLLGTSGQVAVAEPEPSSASEEAEDTTDSPTSKVEGTADDSALSAFGEESKELGEGGKSLGGPKPRDSQAAPPPSGGKSGGSSKGSVKVKNPPKNKKVEVETRTCNNGIRQCQAAQQACTTEGGGYVTAPAQVTWVRVDDGPWQYATVSCGPPTSIEIPETNEGGAVEVELEAPPVPTLAQIQREFRSLPFAKPGVKIQPKGQRTAKNLKTFYAADWPQDDGLGPGDVSEPIKLLSWTIEFKVAAQDYRYSYGDGKTSGWTASTGGTYPDGDITHTYSETGDVEVKVDARLTGQYRVNGGQWQDIDTVADLQDEPSFTLQVRGTKTGLVHR